jgi:hypothetical protein
MSPMDARMVAQSKGGGNETRDNEWNKVLYWTTPYRATCILTGFSYFPPLTIVSRKFNDE